VLLTGYCLTDEVKETEMCGACGTYRGEDKCIQNFGGELKERDQLEDLGVDGRLLIYASEN
jgi:hypothetical protein